VFWRVALASLGILILITMVGLGLGGAAPVSGGASTLTLFVEPEGCWPPPDDYTRVWVNGVQINARTLAMLDHANALYYAWGGTLDFRLAITQGSYNTGGVSASFGTHDGGGAVDLSVRDRNTWAVLTGEIELMIRALRVAGFAAWLRDTGELYPESPIHIHAIAMGDREQSEAARAQIDGRFGYMRGYNGLPQANGFPVPDRYGGPVLCRWMMEQGIYDMRGWPNPYPTPGGTTIPLWSMP
jgi:hypothetical protein